MTTATGLNTMTSRELTQFVMNKEELFILDVRNESDFNDWKIEGERIDVINIPYFELLDGVDLALDNIPNGKNVLVVCAKEGSSKFVAEQLVEAGRSPVFYLEGGMQAWSEHLEPVKIGELKDGGSIYQFVRIGKGCLSYMVVSGGEAVMVDTLRMTDVFENFANEQGVKITHTIDTHLHADHISGGRKLADQVGATYWIPAKDATEVTFDYAKLEEGQAITVGKTTINIQPVYSPGHTIGSTSLVVDGQYLLTGDILFIESIGRPDLAGQAQDWVGDLRQTLYDRYKELSQDLIVLPAHFGKVSELGEGGRVSARLADLYANNRGLNIANDTEFRRMVTENLPEHPNSYQEIRQTNMGKIAPSDEEQREMEIGPNRCAVHDN
ncbi:MBL fold metallo-hydrolase [Paenibacillus solisilvae]|uniref:MBL fold metallo-hydrolase n=1 Tax=Paenibacillus solisilvae TaxID=2486751 RepID=A0ABW0W8K6_9BACL